MAAFNKIPACRLGTNTTIAASTGGAVSTATISGQVYVVRVATTSSAVFIKVGDGSPVAGVTDPVLGANDHDYYICTPGQRVSILGTGAASTTSVTEMS
jgi:hypothetical protein